MTKLIISSEILRSFGRVHGRKLRDRQEELVQNLLPKLAIRIEGEGQGVKGEGNIEIPFPFSHSPSPLSLEIGFGYGEHLVGMAQKYPDVNFIGCEPFINGVATLLKHIEQTGVQNIRILHGDARLLIDKLPDGVLDRVFILFPDPWPKNKHHKKRIINSELLEKLARVIKPGGRLEIATDHVEYGNWIAKHLEVAELFKENKALGLATVPEDWVETRYQLKAREQGRGARFFNYVRV